MKLWIPYYIVDIPCHGASKFRVVLKKFKPGPGSVCMDHVGPVAEFDVSDCLSFEVVLEKQTSSRRVRKRTPDNPNLQKVPVSGVPSSKPRKTVHKGRAVAGSPGHTNEGRSPRQKSVRKVR